MASRMARNSAWADASFAASRRLCAAATTRGSPTNVRVAASYGS